MNKNENAKYYLLGSIVLWISIFFSFAHLFVGKHSLKNLYKSEKERVRLEKIVEEKQSKIAKLKHKISLIDTKGEIDIDLLEELSQKKLSKMPKGAYVLIME
ncbi:MAG: hypothetical protein N4A44_01620 [Alphaproteobacteria bacterium]|jgi:biopolymer transport protein ExbB/TolQ|nr:hypothetical protein [Alphaproteobacteria bacterium]